MRSSWWRSKDWNAICDRCGFKFKASELKKTWDGLMVCSDDWEMRHPQELIRPIPDQQKLPWTRPEPSDISVGPTYSLYSPPGISSTLYLCQADYGAADYATVNNTNGGLII
jgi:hypothetical protein